MRDDHGPIFAVDYSHTPDAVTQAIKALEGLAEARGGRIWIVVGAGGDRDHGKRPLMGQAACAADEVVLTSDNPRSEDAKEILKQIQAGTTKPCTVIEDRRKAIEYAAEHAAAMMSSSLPAKATKIIRKSKVLNTTSLTSKRHAKPCGN